MTEERAGLPIIPFADADALDRWMESQRDGAAGLRIKFAKARSGISSVTKAEAIDVALRLGGPMQANAVPPHRSQKFLDRFNVRSTPVHL